MLIKPHCDQRARTRARWTHECMFRLAFDGPDVSLQPAAGRSREESRFPFDHEFGRCCRGCQQSRPATRHQRVEAMLFLAVVHNLMNTSLTPTVLSQRAAYQWYVAYEAVSDHDVAFPCVLEFSSFLSSGCPCLEADRRADSVLPRQDGFQQQVVGSRRSATWTHFFSGLSKPSRTAERPSALVRTPGWRRYLRGSC